MKNAKKNTKDIRWQAFAEYIAQGKSAVEAYTLAGYSAKGNSAETSAARLFRNVQVLALVEEARKKSSDQRILTAMDIKIFLSRVIRGEITDIDANDQGQAVQSPAKLADRIRAAELLGKVLGMFVEKTDGKLVVTIRRGADSAASLQKREE